MKIKQTVLALAFFVGIFGFVFTTPAAAASCGGANTSVISCPQTGCKDKSTPDSLSHKCSDGSSPTVEDGGVWGILMLVINILSAGVGIAAVGGVAYGSILYTTSGGSVEQTKKARAIIANTIVGIVLYVAMWALLNYMIPGGLFK